MYCFRKKPNVLIVGAFRSGTNATKFTLERFFYLEAVFNRWFWKHGLAPTFQANPLPINVPILLLCRHPCDWALAMHRFWRQRRPELSPPKSFTKFIREPFIVYDNTGTLQRPHYKFSNPINYWNCYYYSWLTWGDISLRRMIIQCENLTSQADLCLMPIAEKFNWRRREAGKIVLPTSRVGPKVDPPRGNEIGSLLPEDHSYIMEQVDHQICCNLGYKLQ